MTTLIIVGLQWGDEGKGKIVDLLSNQVGHIIRSQGGHNAGHTVVVGDEEYSFHMIPSGILYPHTYCYLGGGVVIEPEHLIKEIEGLEKRGISFEGRFFISKYAHLIFPFHILLDEYTEEQKGKRAVGTTGSGIGPCYADKATRIGMRVVDLLDPQAFKEKLRRALEEKNKLFEMLYDKPCLEFEPIYERYIDYAKKLRPFIADVEHLIHKARTEKKNILVEGAQGALLDINFGTYPFVTSSNTTSGGVLAGSGIGPLQIDKVLGIVKAYTTRVGNGPFPTEFSEDLIDHKQAREFGTTTGRRRRAGWFDAFLVRFGLEMSGVSSIVLTKLDILDTFKEIKICIGYELDGQRLPCPPADPEEFDRVQPIYEVAAGWETSTKDVQVFDDLPINAKKYIRRLERLCDTSVDVLSLGPKRKNTIIINPLINNICQ